MKLALLPAILALCCASAHAEGGAEPKPDAVPKELVSQVERLVTLLSDSYATQPVTIHLTLDHDRLAEVKP